MDRWVRVLRQAGVLEEGLDLQLLFMVFANHGEAASPLSVKPEVLRERLSHHHSGVVFGEVPQRPGVLT